MPYIIETRTRDDGKVHAVATLDEARWAAANEYGRFSCADEGIPVPATGTTHFTPSERAVADETIGEGGGTIRLSRGRSIDVRPVEWIMLADLSNAYPDGDMPDDPREREAQILAAFNDESE